MPGPRTTHLLRGKEPLLQKVVFELRYRHGFSYLDKCGRLINTICQDLPEWTIDPQQPNPQAAGMVSLANSTILNIGTKKCDLSLETPIGGDPLGDEDVQNFTQQVEDTTARIIDLLGLREFSRIGFREWHMFPFDDREEAETWLLSLGCYNVSSELSTSFGGKVSAVGVSVVIEGTDRNYRIAFNGVERLANVDLGQAILNVRPRDLDDHQREFLVKQEKVKARLRRSAEYPAMIDIDTYVEKPTDVQPHEFVKEAHGGCLERLRESVGKGN